MLSWRRYRVEMPIGRVGQPALALALGCAWRPPDFEWHFGLESRYT
jgi:hypothetical protein